MRWPKEPKLPTPISDDATLAAGYTYLQIAVAVIALSLPFAVAGGDWVAGNHYLRGSISAYYYGRTGGWFVGSLFAIGVFFLSYEFRPRRGRRIDKILTNAAALMAVGVALFPTPSNRRTADGGSRFVGYVHLACAAGLFLLLAVLSLYHFTKTAREVTPATSTKDRVRRVFRTDEQHLSTMTDRKKRRNKVFRACGWIILGCIGLMLLSNAFHWGFHFWLESIAVITFGFSWLVKGGGLAWFNDLNADSPGRA